MTVEEQSLDRTDMRRGSERPHLLGVVECLQATARKEILSRAKIPSWRTTVAHDSGVSTARHPIFMSTYQFDSVALSLSLKIMHPCSYCTNSRHEYCRLFDFITSAPCWVEL
jgi:hypothetical protein